MVGQEIVDNSILVEKRKLQEKYLANSINKTNGPLCKGLICKGGKRLYYRVLPCRNKIYYCNECGESWPPVNDILNNVQAAGSIINSTKSKGTIINLYITLKQKQIHLPLLIVFHSFIYI
jgi:hypothetical protein